VDTFKCIIEQQRTYVLVRFEVLSVMTLKNVAFWDVVLCTYFVNRFSSETSVYPISTQRNIPEDGILQLTYLIDEAYASTLDATN
jgi:hypothetical protein